jgi:hypothetical protein
MSKRSPQKTRVPPSAGQSSKTRVGTREFNRRAQAVSERTKRRRVRSRQSNQLNLSSLLTRALEALGQVPRAAWLCAAVACINAVCWSILTPPFQVTDEPSHFAYVQQLAENVKLPTEAAASLSPEEEAVLHDLRQYYVRESPETPTISTAAQQRLLQEDLERHLSRHGSGGVGGSHSDPPLFYMLETIPYGLASGGTLLDQLEAMRLFSALMAGLTALFTFLFVREALPGVRWAWTVGGLSVALAPLLGFISGGVNPDSMLIAVSAASFYCLARAFRRGLTHRLAIAIGIMIAIGFLTKLNFIGLVPGIVLGMVLVSVRASRTYGRAAYRSLGIALGIAAAPVLLYLFVNVLSGHPGLGIVSTTLKLKGVGGSILTKISYAWQLYLPRLPGMTNYFPGIATTRDLWFNRGVGFYGWLDTTFPIWVDNLALIPAAILALLCARSLVVARVALRERVAEIVVYTTMGLGLLTLIGLSSYIDSSEGLFSDPRYLLPLLPLLGIGLALAARGAGRRWGPATGALIVVLFLAHDIFSQLLVVGRYYV